MRDAENATSLPKQNRNSRESALVHHWRRYTEHSATRNADAVNCEAYAVQCYLNKYGCYQRLICAIMFLFNIYVKWFAQVYDTSLGIASIPNCHLPANAMHPCDDNCPTKLLVTNDTHVRNAHCLEDKVVSLFEYLDVAVSYVSLLIGPWITDSIGRRPVLVYGLSIQFVCSIAELFSKNMAMLSTFLFLENLVCETTYIAGWVLLMEIVGAQMHAEIVFLNKFARAISDLLFFFAIKIFAQWQSIGTCSLVICGILVFIIWLVPESPLWLLNSNKVEKATRTIALLFKWNREHTMSLKEDDIRANIERALRIHRSSPKSTKQTFVSVFYYRCLRKNFAIYLLIGFSFGMRNHLSTLTDLTKAHMSQWAFPCCEMLGCIIFISAQRYVGRKRNLIYGLFILIALVVLHAFILELNLNIDDRILAVLEQIMASAVEANCLLYFMEYWPTAMRTKFLGVGQIALESGDYVMGILIAALMKAQWITYAIIAVCFIFIVSHTSYFPETKGYPLSLTLRNAEHMTIMQLMNADS